MNLQISLQDDCFEVSRAADWVDGVGSVPSLDECRHCLAQLQVVQEPRGHALWSAHPRVDFHLRTRRGRESVREGERQLNKERQTMTAEPGCPEYKTAV